MPQLTYALNSPFAAVAGSSASSMPEECYTGLGFGAGSRSVLPTAANSTVYTLTFTGASVKTATFTSDASGTVAEIVAGLRTAINANGTIDYVAVTTGIALVLMPKAGVLAPSVITSTGAGTLALSTFASAFPFGVALALDVPRVDALDPQTVPVRLPSAAGDRLLGIVRHTHAYESTNLLTAAAYPAGMAVNVAKKGQFWVTPEAAVVAGDPAFVRITVNGGLNQLGALRADDDSGNAIAMTGARFLSGRAAGVFAVLDINLP